jgi:hypothetical protein
VDPNIFFSAVKSLTPTLLHLHSDLANDPVPGCQLDHNEPTSPGSHIPHPWSARIRERTETIFNVAGRDGSPNSGYQYNGQSKTRIADETLEFETITDLNSLDDTSGVTTVLGTAKTAWEKPFGIQWLTLTNVVLELSYQNGRVTNISLSSEFDARARREPRASRFRIQKRTPWKSTFRRTR